MRTGRTVLTHRIELKPNQRQEALFRQCVGAARFAYNWALAEWQRQLEANEKPNEAALRRQFNAIKPMGTVQNISISSSSAAPPPPLATAFCFFSSMACI